MPLNFLEWSTTLTDLWWASLTIQITFIFYPYFQLPWALSYCRYKPFINSFKFHLFRYKCWLNYCQQQNSDIPYNLNKIYSARYVSKSGLFLSTYYNHLRHLDGNEKLLEIIAHPSSSRAFYDPEFNLQIREKL